MRSDRSLKLTLAYDGAGFAGWQRQKNTRTVQQTLEQAFRRLLDQKVTVTAAGRTDSGVHAEGQVAHAAVRTRLSTPILHRALNALLPEGLLVLSVRTVPSTFHAQYGVRKKWYRYTIWNRPLRPLKERGRVWHVPLPLNIRAMRQAARILQGRYDFRAFHSSGREVASTVRNLSRLRVHSQNGAVFIDAEADGFLYHMVRRLVGLLVEIGKGKHKPAAIRSVLKGGSPIIPPTAPAQGLCLMRVTYPPQKTS